MFPAWKSVEALWAAKELGLNRFVCEQMAYNLLDRTAEREVIPAAQTFGLALIPWAPLCGGLLTGKYRRDDQSAAGRWQGGKDNFGRPATPAAFDVIEGLVALASEKGCTPSQLALAWNASQPGITAPIIGPRTLEQLARQSRCADVKVTDADRARIDALAPPWSADAALLRRRDGDRPSAQSALVILSSSAAHASRNMLDRGSGRNCSQSTRRQRRTASQRNASAPTSSAPVTMPTFIGDLNGPSNANWSAIMRPNAMRWSARPGIDANARYVLKSAAQAASAKPASTCCGAVATSGDA